MITLIGPENTSEYAVALQIKNVLEEQWKGISSSPADQDDIKILANAKICGYKVSDIDVVVCGKLRKGRRLIPPRTIKGRNGETLSGHPISIENFVVAIEVKDHDPKKIKFEGESISVWYKEGWHNATDQNIKQLHSLKDYFGDQQLDAWVSRLVVLRGVETDTPAASLNRNFSVLDFFTEILAISTPFKRGPEWVLRSFTPEHEPRVLAAPLFRQIKPSQIDRKRMDKIASRKSLQEEWFNDLGKKLLIFRGHGGTGKTVLLLQAAYRAFDENGLRTLFLTYNRALTADVMRIMSLMNIPSSTDAGGISIRTVMSLMFSWFYYLGLLEKEEEFALEKYNQVCKEALEMLTSGAIQAGDIQGIKNKNAESLDFDLVVVDEGQDWPQEEVEILKLIYGPNKIVVADGVDQLIRGKRPDWMRAVPVEDRKITKLDRCLRMKENLANFANILAEEAGLAWNVQPSNEAGGGRVIILEKPYFSSSPLHKELMDLAVKAGNAPIDFLFCVPPSDMNDAGGEKFSRLVKNLNDNKHAVWDGTDETKRKDLPRDLNSHRVVQYASCRGLEGWVVVAEALDSFWKNQKAVFELSPVVVDSLKPVDQQAAEYAWKWCLIPMTRPIDTIVITLQDKENAFSQAIKRAASRCADFVEWHQN